MLAKTLYLAGPLFTLAERQFNQALAKELEHLGYLVILPQKVAERFRNPNGSFQLDRIREACEDQVAETLVAVFNLDGGTADDGTSYEAGFRRGRGKRLNIGFRTDFRAAGEDPKNGTNAMFLGLDRIVKYTGSSVEGLATAIDEAICQVRLGK